MPLPYRVVLVQVAVGLIVAGGLWLWKAPEALGALLATAVCALPNGLFARRVQMERSPSRLLGAGVLKLFSIFGLMVLVFWLWTPPPLGFLGVFVLMQFTHAVVGARS